MDERLEQNMADIVDSLSVTEDERIQLRYEPPTAHAPSHSAHAVASFGFPLLVLSSKRAKRRLPRNM